MRILTWNLDHGRHDPAVIEKQQRLLASHPNDACVLTEVPMSMSNEDAGRVLSPVERPGKLGPEAWVRIDADGVEPCAIELPLKRMAAAARATVGGEPFLVYGSVLPWRSANTQADYLEGVGMSPDDLFARVLGEQIRDIRALRAEHPADTFIWAGDFNQPLSGTNAGFSNPQRQILQSALDDLGLIAWNEHLDHANGESHAIDLICGPKDRAAHAERIDPVVDGFALSDHAGYLVQI